MEHLKFNLPNQHIEGEEVNHLIVFNGQMFFQSEFKIALSFFVQWGWGRGEKAKNVV